MATALPQGFPTTPIKITEDDDEDSNMASWRELRPLAEGEYVRIQDHVTKKWNMEGVIVSAKGRNYRVKSGTSIFWRNRRFLIPASGITASDPPSPETQPSTPILKKGRGRPKGSKKTRFDGSWDLVRRSERLKK